MSASRMPRAGHDDDGVGAGGGVPPAGRDDGAGDGDGAPRVAHDDNVVGALAVVLADAMADATAVAAGLSGVPAAALAALHEWAGERPIQALADGLRLSHSRTVRVIDRLEAEGLAQRGSDPRDGRSALVALTPAGVAAAERVLAARATVLHEALGVLGAPERAALARLAEAVLEGTITGRRHARSACRMCDAHACGHHEGLCPVTRGADRGEALRAAC